MLYILPIQHYVECLSVDSNMSAYVFLILQIVYQQK